MQRRKHCVFVTLLLCSRPEGGRKQSFLPILPPPIVFITIVDFFFFEMFLLFELVASLKALYHSFAQFILILLSDLFYFGSHTWNQIYWPEHLQTCGVSNFLCFSSLAFLLYFFNSASGACVTAVDFLPHRTALLKLSQNLLGPACFYVFFCLFLCVFFCFVLSVFCFVFLFCSTTRKGNTLPCLVVKITGHNFVSVQVLIF